MASVQSRQNNAEWEPPEYVFYLIQVSIFAAACDIPALTEAIENARQAGADNREILRAMFRSDDAFISGIESAEFIRIAASLKAGRKPALTA